jgi:hypothetical protein
VYVSHAVLTAKTCLLATIDGRTTGPYIDVVDARVRLPVCVALRAEIFESQILASV